MKPFETELTMRVSAAVAFTLVGASVAHAQTQIRPSARSGWNRSMVVVHAAQSTVDYDTFMQQDVQGRLRTFNAITPENRAVLVRTQVERWLAANQDRLTSDQTAAMRDFIAFVQPDAYRPETRDAYLPRAKELEQRAAALFTREDLRQALTIQGSYIPPK
jgi:hypothetical protein